LVEFNPATEWAGSICGRLDGVELPDFELTCSRLPNWKAFGIRVSRLGKVREMLVALLAIGLRKL